MGTGYRTRNRDHARVPGSPSTCSDVLPIVQPSCSAHPTADGFATRRSTGDDEHLRALFPALEEALTDRLDAAYRNETASGVARVWHGDPEDGAPAVPIDIARTV